MAQIPNLSSQILKFHSMTNKKEDRSTWIIGGTTLLGIGVGFIFLEKSALWFVASVLIGVGLGLIIVPIISKKKE